MMNSAKQKLLEEGDYIQTSLRRDPSNRQGVRRSLGSSLRAQASSGNPAGQRDSGKHGAGGGLARQPPRTSGALPSPSYLKAGGTGGHGLDFRLPPAVTRRRRRLQQRHRRPGLRRALAPRTGDESALFHSKESPGPPRRSTSGFTARLRLPFPRRPIGGGSGVRRASREECATRTARAAGFSRLGWEGGTEVSAGATPALRHSPFPSHPPPPPHEPFFLASSARPGRGRDLGRRPTGPRR